MPKTEPDKHKKPKLLSVVKSILAAGIGVQNETAALEVRR